MLACGEGGRGYCRGDCEAQSVYAQLDAAGSDRRAALVCITGSGIVPLPPPAGFIEAADLATVLKSIGWPSDRKTSKDILKEADIDHDGKVSLDEFLEMMAAQDPDPSDELLDAFKVFDKDGSGFVSAAEFKATLAENGMAKLTDDDIAVIIAEADANHDGKIDYAEFVAAMV